MGAVSAEYTAIAFFRAELFIAVFASVEDDASICRQFFHLGVSAMRAGDL